MRVCSDRLREYLKLIDSGGISESQLSEVVQISRGIIQSHLGYMRSSIAHLCLRQGLSLVDLSYDCIAEAFARDAGNSFRSIHDFLGSLEKDLGAISNEELFLAYKSFLIRIAEAQLARLYGQSDPSGSPPPSNWSDLKL